LIFQDEVHGNLFDQVEKTMELLFTKYIKAIISYKEKFRMENYEYPYDAVREAIHNAVAHKDYTGATPIQISVYKDKIMIWNYGQLPEDWTMNDLLQKHSSRPHNPDISTAFFRIGYIEAWGRGMDKMKKQCIEANLPAPTVSVKGHDFWIVFNKELDLTIFNLNERQLDALQFFKKAGEISATDYMKKYNISERTARYDLSELAEKNLIGKQGEKKQTKYIFAVKMPLK
jgi:ATP-dependent DNA helicase RecG